MDDLTRLVAIEDIKQLFARYYRALDLKDWDAFEAAFTDDAVMDMSQPDRILIAEDGLYRGARAIRTFAERAIGEGQTIDKGVMPIIEFTSDTSATGIWAQEDRLAWPDGHPNRRLHGHGYEHHVYEKVEGRWRIKHVRLQRLHVDIVRAGD